MRKIDEKGSVIAIFFCYYLIRTKIRHDGL